MKQFLEQNCSPQRNYTDKILINETNNQNVYKQETSHQRRIEATTQKYSIQQNRTNKIIHEKKEIIPWAHSKDVRR